MVQQTSGVLECLFGKKAVVTMLISRITCFVYGLWMTVCVYAQRYEAIDMSCPANKLHSRPASNERTITIYMSIEDRYHVGVAPICLLQLRLPQIVNMYQAMLLAQSQQRGRFNFSARSDEQAGFALQYINGKWGRTSISVWVLHDADTGQAISKSITEVFVEHGKSYTWVYTPYSAIGEPYIGVCRSGSTYPQRPVPSVNHAILYLSVQFWSNTWPLCKLPVLIINRSQYNLDYLMMEARRQYKHKFVYQRYPDYRLYDINDLHSEGGYFWRAEIADKNRELSEVLTAVVLEDGDHVVWRYVNENGEPRYKTVRPDPTENVTPSEHYSKSSGSNASPETDFVHNRSNSATVLRFSQGSVFFPMTLLATILSLL